MNISMEEIYSAYAEKGPRGFEAPEQPTMPTLPTQVKAFTNYNLEAKHQYTFVHSQKKHPTLIAYGLNHELECPKYLKDDQDTFERVFMNIMYSAYNVEYVKRLLVTRKTHLLNHVKSINLAESYFDFVKDLAKKVYKTIYKRKMEIKNLEFAKSHDFFAKGDENFLRQDLLNDSVLMTIGSLQEIMDSVSDDEVSNCIIMSSHTFTHPINWLLSPAALALSFFHSQIMKLKKRHKEDETYYSKSSLPRVTYLSLTGIYSEIDIDILNTFCDNMQTIIVYDENTGGPKILQDRFTQDDDLRNAKKHYEDVSEKLLLIPMACSPASDRKSFSPNDILTIVEEMVVKSIEKYKPQYIVLNCSFTFDENSNNPFELNEETLAHIIHLLSLVCDNKIIVYPFKLADQQDKTTREIIQKARTEFLGDKGGEKYKERFDYIFSKYATPYNEIYLRNCFTTVFETLACLRDPNLFNRAGLRKKYGVNPAINKLLYLLGRHYKEHPYYHFLYSKSYNFIAKLANKDPVIQNKTLSDAQSKIINSLTLFYPDNDVTVVKLSVTSDGTKEVILDSNSQYFINYDNIEEPIIYIFNAKLSELTYNSAARTYDNHYSHFALTLELEDTIRQYTVDDYEQIKIEEPEDFEPLINCGICHAGSYVFQVYGTNTKTNEDSNQVHYFDFKDEKQYKINIVNNVKEVEILPRHSVTACAFEKDDKYYLYIFGGQVRSKSVYRGKEIGSLSTIDIVEVYETKDPSTEDWTYTILPKQDMVRSKNIGFIPFCRSFAFYNPDEKVIILMGGSTDFKETVHDWTFPVFKFSPLDNKFISFQIFLNDMKDNPNRKEILNSTYKRAVIPTAVADINKNFYFNKRKGIFKFVVPCREDNLITLYTYNYTEQACDFIQTPPEKEGKSVKVTPPTLNKDSTASDRCTLKYVALDFRLASLFEYMFNDLAGAIAVLELVNLRLNLDDELSQEDYNDKVLPYLRKYKDMASFFGESQPSAKDKTSLEFRKEGLDEEKAFHRLDKLATNNKPIQEIFINKDSRLEVLHLHFLEKVVRYLPFDFISFLEKNRDIMTTPTNNSEESTAEAPTQPFILNSSELKELFHVTEEVVVKLHMIKTGDDVFRQELDQIVQKIHYILNPTNVSDKKGKEKKDSSKDPSNESTRDTSKIEASKGDATKDSTRDMTNTSTYQSNQFSFEPARVAETMVRILKRLGLELMVRKSRSSLDRDALDIVIEPLKEIIEEAKKVEEKEREKAKEKEREKEANFSTILNSTDLENSRREPIEEKKEEYVEEKAILKKESQTKVAEVEKVTPQEVKKEEAPKPVETPLPVKKVEEPIKAKEITQFTPTPLPRVETFSQGTQTDKMVPEEEKTGGSDEADIKVDDVNVFKTGLKTPNPSHAFFNTKKSELNLVTYKEDGSYEERRLRFKVRRQGKIHKEYLLDDISFEFTPCSVQIYQNIVLCYIDIQYKTIAPDLYAEWKNCVLYADINTIGQPQKAKTDTEYLLFRKLFLVTQDEHIYSRSLLVNESSILLVGGKSYKFRGKPKAQFHHEILAYTIDKFKNMTQNSSDFKDTQADNLDNIKGECLTICDGKDIFVCKRETPSEFEIFDLEGTYQESVEFPDTLKKTFEETLKGYTIRMNFIEYNGKNAILFTLFCLDQKIECFLFYIEDRSFETKNISLVPQDPKSTEKQGITYSGFEEIQTNVNTEMSKQILLYSWRGDKPEIIPCQIKAA